MVVSRPRKALGAVLVAVMVAGLGTGIWSFLSPQPQKPALPSTASVWHPVEVTPAPQAATPESNVVVPASAPVRLEIPTIGFDSSKLAGGTSNPIQQWTKAMNDASNGEVTPPGKIESSLVWDSTVAGGGLFGTDAQSSGRILAHTTPWTWDKAKQGAFQHLRDVHEGDSVAITTEKGRLCYSVVKVDSILKPQINVVYGKDAVVQGTVYLITCDRTRNYGEGATTHNLVVTLQLNQQQTNTGSC